MQTEKKEEASHSRSIIDMNHNDAKAYFLQGKNYCNLELPLYFTFEEILLGVDKALFGKKLSDLKQGNPRLEDNINYKLLNNKDGRYAWRTIQLIHPVLYVSLLQNMTTEENWKIICDRFKKFAKNPKIECISLPRQSLSKNSDKAEQITNWWAEVEQKSIELALDYECLFQTDITDCYGAIYTHSIAWALHDKNFMKQKQNRSKENLLGNILDRHLQDMSHGQTNGIPQGSVLMDFIAEIVLGYADSLLSEEIQKTKITDYKIIRYRDDYRIFTNNPRDGENIMKYITEILLGLGLKLSAEKTKATNDVIQSSIKNDKLYWMKQKQRVPDLQKHFLIIHGLAHEYPNSGSLTRALTDYHARLIKVKKLQGNVISLISIATDIATKSPRTYPLAVATISCLLVFLNTDEQKIEIIDKIIDKFKNIPNTGYLLVWLQRMTLSFKPDHSFEESLCALVLGKKEVEIWNNDWLKKPLQKIISAEKIIDKKLIDGLPKIIQGKEVSLFKGQYY
jgi:RNA-directed DNA polymerase